MDFVRVANTKDIPKGEGRMFDVGGRQVAVFNAGGKFYAIDNTCEHQGGPLAEGELEGSIVTCPWHGFQFDVTSGQHQTSKSLVHPTFPVKVENGGVFVEV